MFVERQNLDSLIPKLETSAISRFLLRQGYQLRGREEGRAEAYGGSRGDIILLPIDRTLNDFIPHVLQIVEMFAVDGLTVDDVVTLMVLPDSDILRYRIDTPEAAFGNLRLSYSYEAMHALFDVLKFSAAGVSTHRTDYRNVSDEAQAYAKTCRFGQTELGSYVMKVYCPTRPVPIVEPGSEPFGRTSTRSTVENFEFIASEESADPSTPLPPTLNRQVAAAVKRLKPDSDFGRSYLTVRYLPVVVPERGLLSEPPIAASEPELENVQLDLGPFIYGRAQSIRDRLKKAEEFGREVVSGYITDLHKDRPNLKTEQSQQISLEVKYGSNFRKVTMRLLPAMYRQAVIWHDNNGQVRLDAVFDKRGRPWSVSELFELSLLDKTAVQGSLFSSLIDPE